MSRTYLMLKMQMVVYYTPLNIEYVIHILECHILYTRQKYRCYKQ